MARFRDKLKLVVEDLILIGSIGAVGIFVFTGLEYAYGWAASNSPGNTGLNKLSITIFEYVHFSWTLAIVFLFFADSIKTALLLVISPQPKTKQDQPKTPPSGGG